MTELLYLSDPYIQRFEATIVDHIGGAVVLDKTAFYPGGGGQPSDQGQLFADEGLWQVIKVKRIGGEIGHYLDGESPSVGTQVVGQLDWPRRYNLMRIHTALHILCGVIWRDYKSSVTGGNMEPLNGRMDFEFETMRQELVSEIEEAINREVTAERDILVRTLPREEAFQIPDLIRTKINLLPVGIKEVRTVEIVGLDLQADGGTHVANTREVGNIRVVDYKSKGKINKRIYIELDA
ncbi:MAG: Ala-tRNA(Pro) hydrolase [Anaerolineae bacterium SG8_19]|jgi:misacylated tRNA(Ala) deacylase|nr:MAG: Ala-tRNA(Pro) hydrolase [Anaerolineae bacterium SG8_19]